MSKYPKVVSFDRSAAYLHHRAMMNRRDNHTVDALELMRRAVEASPENSEYRLDLAELYCEMGCHEQSARLLLDMLSKGNAPSECYYGLAMNQLGMSDITGAKQSLDLYRKKSPQGAHAEEVDALAMELDMYAGGNRPASRRLYRAMRVADRACEAMKGDNPEKACRLFESSLRMASEQYEMRALYAMALMMSSRESEARAQADRACAGYPPSVRALCVCAQVYNMLGDRARAVALMEAAEKELPQGPELRLMIYSAGEMGMSDKAAEYARLALQETPFDRELLHIRAVAMKQSGAPDAEAGRCWERILRLDPEDSVAQFHSEAAAHNALGDCRLDYSYQVPDGEYVRRMKALTDALSGQDFDALQRRWHEEPDFRRLLRWAAHAEDVKLGRAAVTVLSAIDAEDARSELREMMVRPGVPRELKLHALMIERLRGRPIQELLPAMAENVGTALVDIDALMSGLPVGERQLVRYADEVLDYDYDIRALPALALMWSGYRALRGLRGDPLKRIEASAGALAYNYLLLNGMTPRIGKLARQFGCDARQLVFCARRMAATLERGNRG